MTATGAEISPRNTPAIAHLMKGTWIGVPLKWVPQNSTTYWTVNPPKARLKMAKKRTTIARFFKSLSMNKTLPFIEVI